jgi:hypothetical protein
MDWDTILQDAIAGAIGSTSTLILGTILASILVPLWIRPRLKLKGVTQKGHWVQAIVKCRGREAARNAQGYLTLVTEAFHGELLKPAGKEKKYFLMPEENAPLQVQDDLVHWAVRPNPRRVDVQPRSTSLANIGKFIDGGFTVMSEEGYEMEDDEGNEINGRQRMRLNTTQREYELEFFASADNAKPSKRIRFVVNNETMTVKPKWLWHILKRA